MRRLLAATPGVTIVNIDEFNTSCTCHHCGNYFVSEEEMAKKIKVRKIHSLRMCTHYAGHGSAVQRMDQAPTKYTYGIVFDRDVNAAYNHRLCFHAMLSPTKTRPEHLRRPIVRENEQPHAD